MATHRKARMITLRRAALRAAVIESERGGRAELPQSHFEMPPVVSGGPCGHMEIVVRVVGICIRIPVVPSCGTIPPR